MEREKFQELVAFVEKELEVPPGVIFAEGYEDWQTRLRLARILSKNFQKYEEAISLFESGVREKPQNIEQFEDIVWALKDLFVCIYQQEKNMLRALPYLEQAITLAELDSGKQFTCFNRGELWCWRWVVLKELGQLQKAVWEAQEKIKEWASSAAPGNSYLYYAYYFISTLAYAEEEYEAALEGLNEALKYFPPSSEMRAQLDGLELAQGMTAKEKFDKMLALTREGGQWLI